MYFKIFYTFMLLFVISNLAVDLYNFYNTGVWEPFATITEGFKNNEEKNIDPNWKQVAVEGEIAKCNGLVRFGANNDYVVKHSIGNLPCTEQVFGKHLPGVSKTCDCKIADWTKDKRTELVTQKIDVKDPGLCLPDKGGLVTYQGKACGRDKNKIQWSKIWVDPDQTQKQFKKTGCEFKLEEDEKLVEFKIPSIKRNNLIRSGVILPFAYSIDFDYTPTAVTNKTGWENIFRITDGKTRSVDSFKDRLVGVFKRKNSTKLQIVIGTVAKTHSINLEKNFRKGRTYNIKIEVRNNEVEIFVSGSLNHTEEITAKRDIINECHLYFSDSHYEPAKCVIENFVMKRLGSDPDWVSKYFGKCGEIPKIQEKSRSLQLNTKMSELLRFDQAGKSQTVEWEAISKKKKEHKHIPQPKPIARLTPKYIPFLDDNNREWIPNWINTDNPGQEEHIKIGKYFTKGVQNLRGLDLPKIYDSEYQLIGRTVLRAENNKRRGADDKELLKQKEHISKIFDELMGLDSGEYHGNINNKRSAPQYTGVPAYTQPDQTIKHQTNNMFSDNSNKKHVDTNKNTYTTKYRPRDPNLYPRPVDGIWSFVQ